jgi:hypothetical protein
MPVNNAGRYNYTSPIYGEMGYFRPGDEGPSVSDSPLTIAALAAITTATTSAAIVPGCRGLTLNAAFSDNTTTVDVIVFAADGTTPIITWIGVNALNADQMYATGNEGVNFLTQNGLTIFIRVQNFRNGSGSVTVKYHKVP